MTEPYYATEVERKAPLSAADEVSLFNAYRRRKTKAIREKIVDQYLYWAADMACRYCGPRYAKSDAISAANLGLMLAIDKFDPACGKRFVWWSFLYIRRAIVDDMRTNSYLINPYPALNAAKYSFHKAGKTPEAAEALKASRAQIFEAVGSTESLEPKAGSAREELDESTILGDEQLTPCEVPAIENRSMLAAIRRKLSSLEPQERKIIRLRYLGPKTIFFKDIGVRLRLSKDHVRYVHDRAVLKLRAGLKKEL